MDYEALKHINRVNKRADAKPTYFYDSLTA